MNIKLFCVLTFAAYMCEFFFFFFFSPNDSPSKSMKDIFLFHPKISFRSRDIQILGFSPSTIFLLVSHCLRAWSKINLKDPDVINCLNKNLIKHFVWFLEKGKRYDIETLTIDTVLNKEHFYVEIIQKMCTKG